MPGNTFWIEAQRKGLQQNTVVIWNQEDRGENSGKAEITEIYRTESQIEENYVDKKLQKSA